MDFENLIYTREQGIATITMNRPQKLNAFTPAMYRGLARLVGMKILKAFSIEPGRDGFII